MFAYSRMFPDFGRVVGLSGRGRRKMKLTSPGIRNPRALVSASRRKRGESPDAVGCGRVGHPMAFVFYAGALAGSVSSACQRKRDARILNTLFSWKLKQTSH